MPQDRFPFRRSLPIRLVLCWLVPVAFCHADDWPQILGPQRNGVINNGRIGDVLPRQPKVVWRHQVGQGYAGPVVVGEQVFIFHRLGASERVEAVDRETGNLNWSTDFPAVYTGGFNSDSGPRCVPLVHQGTYTGFKDEKTTEVKVEIQALEPPAVSDDELFNAMVEHPILVNRPIVCTPKGVACWA